jgi:hypothetical protein
VILRLQLTFGRAYSKLYTFSRKAVFGHVLVTGTEAARYFQAMYALYPRPLSIVTSISTNLLLVILLIGIVDNVEESELIDTLGGRDNSEPISQLLLLEELLRPIPNTSAFISLFSFEVERV